MPPATSSSRFRQSAWPPILALAISLALHGMLIIFSDATSLGGDRREALISPPPPLQIILGQLPATVRTTRATRHHMTAQTRARPEPAIRRHVPATQRRIRTPEQIRPDRAVMPMAPSLQRQGRPSLQNLLAQAAAPTDEPDIDMAPPKRLVFGHTARGVMWQQYMDDWVHKMERVGAMNFPQEVRSQGLTGGPVLSVVINADGSLGSLRIARSSGNPTLDSAAENLVRLAAPFSPFPPTLAKQARSLEISRKWTFSTQSDLSVR